ncbi:class I SAM-dependent methyltransferase [Actinomadura hibisca]|uniref:class I SAM-dependent methyltransferase n=1 Tax=Actinomadura hibisca TaxID=68565 RepID=UPI0009FE1EE2|nr:class I SAM-dependent methyltransferase [Actinomadura hibisca]
MSPAHHRFVPAVTATGPSADGVGHWDRVYRDNDPLRVNWSQDEPQPSLDLICAVDRGRRGAVIDVGGGASPLAAWLVREGFEQVSVLDVAEQALDSARRSSGSAARAIDWIHADLLTWRPERTWTIWHDRAVFHFLTDPADRAVYLDVLRRALEPGGAVVLGTFAPDGPDRCSGLPVVRYDTDELAAQLGDDFSVLLSHVDWHHTPDGDAQPFAWVTARRH